MTNNKHLAWVLIGIVVVALIGYAAVVALTKRNVGAPIGGEPDGVMCTMEAKLCPDGSFVGRTGPNCEFTPCPGDSDTPPTEPAPIPLDY